jgi:hypothetical protein
MLQTCLRYVCAVVSLVVLCALPAQASVVTVDITAACGCKYAVHIAGNTEKGPGPVKVFYSFQITVDETPYTVQGDVDVTADSHGAFDVTLTDLPLPLSCDDVVVYFSNGFASISFNGGAIEGGFTINLPDTPFFCDDEEPTPGKTFDIGPSSMEGRLLIRPGDWISGGYSFKFVNGGHASSTVTAASTLRLPFKCDDDTTGQFTINLGTQTHSVPAGNTDWQPTGDANSVLSWAGSAQAPDGCGGGAVMENTKGAIFEVTVSQSPDNGSLLNWRFKYRDPNAKGKGNVNCLDTSDPRRKKADVCGASWSQTVRDP